MDFKCQQDILEKISIGIEYWPADKLSIAQWLERGPSNPAVGGRGLKPWWDGHLCILKPSSNRSPIIFTFVQKVKIGHTKRFNSKVKSKLCRDFVGYFISK